MMLKEVDGHLISTRVSKHSLCPVLQKQDFEFQNYFFFSSFVVGEAAGNEINIETLIPFFCFILLPRAIVFLVTFAPGVGQEGFSCDIVVWYLFCFVLIFPGFFPLQPSQCVMDRHCGSVSALWFSSRHQMFPTCLNAQWLFIFLLLFLFFRLVIVFFFRPTGQAGGVCCEDQRIVRRHDR